MSARENRPSDTLLHVEAGMELGADQPLAAAEEDRFRTTRVSSPTRDAWRRYRRNWAAILSLVVVAIIIIMAVLAPFMHTADPSQPDFGAIQQAPSALHWFGTDMIGRDTYSRLVYALRIPLEIAFVGTIITVFIGTILGVVAGYAGGVTDSILSRFTDLMFAFPGFTLSLIVISVFGPSVDRLGMGGTGRVLLLTVVFSVVSWPALMRFVRSLALSMKEQQFVEAARTSGSGAWGIMRRHLLPNMYGLILVQAGFIIVAVIGNETVLAIFGLTVQEPDADLGTILYNGIQNIGQGYWLVLFPGLVLATLILAFTFATDGVRDAVDPRSRP
jgi:peptide/nickel transport system permease protein